MMHHGIGHGVTIILIALLILVIIEVVRGRPCRGQRLYLVSAKRREFTWTANRTLALPLSIDVALRIIEECEEFAKGTDAFAIDKNDQIIAKANNGAITRLSLTVKCVLCSWAFQVTEPVRTALQIADDADSAGPGHNEFDDESAPVCPKCGGPVIAVKAVRS